MNAEAMQAIPIGKPRRHPGGVPPAELAQDRLRAGKKGRGAVTNPPNRFEERAISPFDDGWGTLPAELTDLPPLPTEIIRDSSRSIISTNESPDLGFDRSVNPYRGCEHGCIYCYARPTHAYLGYSPGTDFETKLIYKPEAAHMLERELSRGTYKAKPIVLGSNTDPYQPIDRTLKLTRSVLEVLDRFNHPVIIVTKSAGVLRDVDILRSMAARRLARVHLSVTTLDPELARRMEPRASSPARRLAAIAALAQEGIPAGVLAAPMIPGLNDSELESILKAAAQAQASEAGYVLLRLPLELARMFEDWLALNYPDRARHVLQLVRETRADKLNDPKFGHRFRGTGAYADLLGRRFEKAARQLGLLNRAELDCDKFAPPQAIATAQPSQLSLL